MQYSDNDKKRVKQEDLKGSDKGRTEFRRDFGRLLHSPAFRRLQGKTQLFPSHESDFFRNRLTHSLEVAQVAKGLALLLNATEPALAGDSAIDTDLVEMAALAHDLGHPPFGHNGESALDDCMKSYGGFEGNAQTLRLLAKIEKKVLREPNTDIEDNSRYCGISPSGEDMRLGLNLTFRSLAAVLKYDREIPESRGVEAKLVKGYYGSEADLVKLIKQHVGKPPEDVPFKTIECQIMDLADDIAYSTYDLEDTMKGGFGHPLELKARLTADPALVKRIHEKVLEAVPDAKEFEVFSTLQELFDLGEEDSSASEASPTEEVHNCENASEVKPPKAVVVDANDIAIVAFNLSKLLASQGNLRAGFTSSLVDKFMNGVRLAPLTGEAVRFSKVYLERATLIQIESLKRLNYELMIMSPRLKVVEYRGYDLVCTIFKCVAKGEGHLLLPEDYRLMYSRIDPSDKPARMRLVCDFVAGMTDRYAVEFHSRLTGSGASIFKPVS